MRKGTWIVGILIVGVLAVTFGVSPVFAHGPGGGETTTADEDVWEEMHEACELGDWEAMIEAAEEIHGEDFSSMPCHGEDGATPANYRGRWGGGHMGGGMMGGGMMGGW